MKKFLYKSALFLVLTIAMLQTSELLVPYYWADIRMVSKVEHLKSHAADYDVLFIGSSNVYRHIMPSLFDRKVPRALGSFNFGIQALLNPESYAFYEHFLQETIPPSVRYVIMDLSPVIGIAELNLQATRTKYYLNAQYYWYAIHHFLTNQRSRLEIKNYTIAYTEKLFKIGLLADMIEFALSPPKIDPRWLGKKADGFYSAEAERLDKIHLPWTLFQFRWDNFKKDPGELLKRFQDIKTLYRQKNSFAASKPHIEKIQELIQRSREKGVHLIFYLPPRYTRQAYMELLPVFNQIDTRHRMDLANPFTFPEFYSVEDSYDEAHFNDKGAALFTEKIAEKFNRLVQ